MNKRYKGEIDGFWIFVILLFIVVPLGRELIQKLPGGPNDGLSTNAPISVTVKRNTTEEIPVAPVAARGKGILVLLDKDGSTHNVNINELIKQKAQFIISKQIVDKTLDINFTDIIFLKPNWPNLIRVKIKDINVKSTEQQMNSNVKTIELGMSYISLLKNLIPDEKVISFDYIDIKNITLNGKVGKNQFYPGPIMTALLTIKKNNLQKVFKKNISIGNIKLRLIDIRNSLEKGFKSMLLSPPNDYTLINHWFYKTFLVIPTQ